MRNRDAVKEPRPPKRPGRWYRRTGFAALATVGATGAVLSWESLYLAAAEHLGRHSPTVTIGGASLNATGAVFSLLLDGLILASSLLYVAGVKSQHPSGGWRILAHAGVVGTVLANVASAGSIGDATWRAVAPLAWSAIVELTARDVLGELRAVRRMDGARIPWQLWLSAPAEQIRTTWRMFRTLEPSAQAARVASDRCAAASVALSMAIPGWRHLRRRRRITRRMWAGTIGPEEVFDALDAGEPDAIVRAALQSVLAIRPDRPSEVNVSASLDGGAEDPAQSVGLGWAGSDAPADQPLDDPIGLDESDGSDELVGSEPIGLAGAIRAAATHRVALASVPDRVESAAAIAARPKDLAAAEAAIRAGRLSHPLTADAIRDELRIGLANARLVRDALQQRQAEG